MSISLLVLFACTRTSSEDDSAPVADDSAPAEDDSGKTDDTGKEACTVSFDEAIPADGTTDAFYQDPIEVAFDLPDPTSVIVLEPAGGEPVTGTTTRSGSNDVVIFTPDQPLEPSTSYDATVTWCGGSYAWSFTTSAFGEPLTDPESLIGRTYSLDLASGRWVAPVGADAYIGDAFTNSLLLMVVDFDATTITQRVTLSEAADAEAQDTCLETQDIAGVDFTEAPYFQLGPTPLTLNAGGIAATIEDAVLSGAFSADGSTIGGVAFAGFADMRDLAPGFGLSAEEFCGYASAFGIQCIACADSEELCLGVEIDSMEAAEVDESLEEITVGYCHAECSANSKDCVL